MQIDEHLQIIDRKKMMKNLNNQKFVILPSGKLLEKSLKLGMPMFEILEDQVLDNPEGYAQMKSSTSTRLGKSGSSGTHEFFKSIHKERFQKLRNKNIHIDVS